MNNEDLSKYLFYYCIGVTFLLILTVIFSFNITNKATQENERLNIENEALYLLLYEKEGDLEYYSEINRFQYDILDNITKSTD